MLDLGPCKKINKGWSDLKRLAPPPRMFVIGMLLAISIPVDWHRDSGWAITPVSGDAAMAYEITRLESTCSQSEHEHISSLLTFSILCIAFAWIVFLGTQKFLQSALPRLRWIFSAFLASIAIYGASLFAIATVQFSNCELIEVAQLHEAVDDNGS